MSAVDRGTARNLLAMAVTALLLAGVVVGCSSGARGPDGTSGSGARPSTSVEAPAPVFTAGDAPLLTGAPDPRNAPAPLWQAGTTGPDPLRQFGNTPYNNDGAAAPTVVAAPGLTGRTAIRFEIPAGGKRSELDPNVDVIQEGAEFWYGFAHELPADFPVNTQDWQVVAQWKNAGEGSPPIEVKIGRGQFTLDGGAGNDPSDYFSMPIGSARPGQTNHLVVHIVFSSDPAKAVVDVWQNGQQRIAGFHPPGGTRYPSDDSYLKTGIYRDTDINQDATLFLLDARIASSYASAAALPVPSSSG